jgi:hypothetical protein
MAPVCSIRRRMMEFENETGDEMMKLRRDIRNDRRMLRSVISVVTRKT